MSGLALPWYLHLVFGCLVNLILSSLSSGIGVDSQILQKDRLSGMPCWRFLQNAIFSPISKCLHDMFIINSQSPWHRAYNHKIPNSKGHPKG